MPLLQLKERLVNVLLGRITAQCLYISSGCSMRDSLHVFSSVQVSADSVFTSCLQGGCKGRGHYGCLCCCNQKQKDRVAVCSHIHSLLSQLILLTVCPKPLVHTHSKQDVSNVLAIEIEQEVLTLGKK